ncbi:receptor-like protein kinase FERONIA [Tanacetum coccineum]
MLSNGWILCPTKGPAPDQFIVEIERLSKLRHCHLVSLIGYCDDNKEMILVLYTPWNPISSFSQSWDSFYWSFNILLDKKWPGMISDSGLSKTTTTIQSSSCVDASVKGTFEYMDPEIKDANNLPGVLEASSTMTEWGYLQQKLLRDVYGKHQIIKVIPFPTIVP